MSQTIDTNIAAMNTRRNLDMSGVSLQSALQHLSSGLRINNTKDDATGLAFPNEWSSGFVILPSPDKN